jgi:anti-anti-sigma factor
MKTHADGPMLVRVSPIVHAPEQLRSLADRKADSDVILDVSDLGFATSMLISELLELRASITSHGHRLVICCTDTRVRGIFNICALHKVFTIVDSQTAAFDMLNNAD